jgi:hypothetical protein
MGTQAWFLLPNEENANTGIVLGPLKVQVFDETIQLAVDKGIAVQKIEEIHRPERRLD